MDKKTLDYYNSCADQLVIQYKSGNPDYLKTIKSLYSKGCNILDIGCGSGRDLKTLLNMGYDCYGVDPSDNFVKNSLTNYSFLKGRIELGSLPYNIPDIFIEKKWDNILLAATLQHIPDSNIESTAQIIKKLLKKEGNLIISVPTEYPEIVDNRDKNLRLFCIRSAKSYISLFEKQGFKLVKNIITTDALNRTGIEWTTLLFRS